MVIWPQCDISLVDGNREYVIDIFLAPIISINTWIIDVKVIGVYLEHFKDLKTSFNAIIVNTTVAMLVKEFLIRKLCYISKHNPIFYMVPVDDGIKVFELGFISSLKENSSCSCKFSLGILVQVFFIVFGLD